MTEWVCDAVLFDLDGVLVDSRACVERHWHRWALEHDLSFEEIMRVAHGYRTVDTIRLVAPHLAAARKPLALTRVRRRTLTASWGSRAPVTSCGRFPLTTERDTGDE